MRPAITFDLDAPGHLPFKRYENLVYQYAFSLPGEFQAEEPYSDYSQPEMVYENRDWYSPDGSYRFYFQLKKPTYAGMDEEIAMLPRYLDLIGPSVESVGGRGLRFVHEDPAVMRELPAGRMLENATQYEYTDEDGQEGLHISVYYDYYDGYNEYIFGLDSRTHSYEEVAALLSRIGETITLTPIRVLIDDI